MKHYLIRYLLIGGALSSQTYGELQEVLGSPHSSRMSETLIEYAARPVGMAKEYLGHTKEAITSLAMDEVKKLAYNVQQKVDAQLKSHIEEIALKKLMEWIRTDPDRIDAEGRPIYLKNATLSGKLLNPATRYLGFEIPKLIAKKVDEHILLPVVVGTFYDTLREIVGENINLSNVSSTLTILKNQVEALKGVYRQDEVNEVEKAERYGLDSLGEEVFLHFKASLKYHAYTFMRPYMVDYIKSTAQNIIENTIGKVPALILPTGKVTDIILNGLLDKFKRFDKEYEKHAFIRFEEKLVGNDSGAQLEALKLNHDFRGVETDGYTILELSPTSHSTQDKSVNDEEEEEEFFDAVSTEDELRDLIDTNEEKIEGLNGSREIIETDVIEVTGYKPKGLDYYLTKAQKALATEGKKLSHKMKVETQRASSNFMVRLEQAQKSHGDTEELGMALGLVEAIHQTISEEVVLPAVTTGLKVIQSTAKTGVKVANTTINIGKKLFKNAWTNIKKLW